MSLPVSLIADFGFVVSKGPRYRCRKSWAVVGVVRTPKSNSLKIDSRFQARGLSALRIRIVQISRLGVSPGFSFRNRGYRQNG